MLIQRFMLNLRRSSGSRGESITNSEVRHFSRFSISFRVPSNLLGNIGESLDHSQSERLHDDDPSQIHSSGDHGAGFHSPDVTHSHSSRLTVSRLEDKDIDQTMALEPASTSSKHELPLEGAGEVSCNLVSQSVYGFD